MISADTTFTGMDWNSRIVDRTNGIKKSDGTWVVEHPKTQAEVCIAIAIKTT